MKIGKFKLKNPLSLAPMADVTDIAYREQCAKLGCGFTITEMVNSHAVVHENPVTQKTYSVNPDVEKPSCIQLFGADKDSLIEAAKILETKCDILNFNMGCPAQKIVDLNAGSALLKDLSHAKDILKTLKDELSIPVTLKTRIGYDDDIKVKEVATMCENIGIDALMIHGRTKVQGYFGSADWNSIEDARKYFNGPLVGNGDVVDEISAKKMLEFCDGAMIGRAAIGNPFLFRRINHFLETGKMLPKETKEDKINAYKDYVKLAEKYDINSYPRMKRQAMWFTKGLPNSKDIRSKIVASKSFSEIKDVLKDL